MSYDLTFCRKESRPLNQQELLGFLKKYPWFKDLPNSDANKFEVMYENPDTGVYFSFDYDAQHTCEGEEVPCTPAGFYPVGLWFNINFMRPTYFAQEAMPIVEDMCRELNLLVVDPQGEELQAKECHAEELIAIWEKYNQVGSALRADFYPKEKAHVWWRYMLERARLEHDLEGKLFVPKIFLFKKKWRKMVYEVITWTDAIPCLFPKCDLVVVQKSKNDPLGPNPEFASVLIPYEKLIKKLQPYLKQYGDCPRSAYALYPEQHKDVELIFNQFRFDPDHRALRKLRPANCMDVKASMRYKWTKRILRTILLLFVIWVFGSNAVYRSAIGQTKSSWRQGNHTEIVSYAKRALRFADSRAERAIAYYWMGIGEYRQGNLDAAERYERKALKINSEYGAAYVTLGAILDAKGEKPAAWQAARLALKLEPNYAWAHNLMGVLFLEDGQVASAIPYFERAIAIDPEQEIFQQNLKQAREALSHN